VGHRIRIGCSGWHYTSWRGVVYPAGLPAREWLSAYAQALDCVEINNSFYRLPEAATFDAWRAAVPRGFVFAVKASRFLTHYRRLSNPVDPLRRLLDRVVHLGPHLGPLIYQLPPRWVPDDARLMAFLEALPARVSEEPRTPTRLRHVIEFRDPRGYEDDTLRLLQHYGVAVCVHDMQDVPSPRIDTGPFTYVRLHGHGQRYGGRYPRRVLRSWATWLKSAAAKRPVFVFFNNDIDGFAFANAQELRGLTEG
jgi:uncharacterized protein YecE (DUF72 family)